MSASQAFNRRKLGASALVCFGFGSIHAYGVLLIPVEAWLGVGRGAASLGYSLAIVALTAGVYANGKWTAKLPKRVALLFSAGLAACGLLVCAVGQSIAGLLIGFGVMFGLANGMAYARSLSIAADACPGREPTGLGIATAAYGAGAVVFAQAFSVLVPVLGVAPVLAGLAVLIMASCGAGALLTGPDGARSTTSGAPRAPAATSGGLVLLWATYLLGAFSGLLIIAHALGIAEAVTGQGNLGAAASGLVSVGSVAGGYLGGLLSGKLSIRHSVALPLLAQAAAAAVLALVSGPAAALTLLALLGLCYGVLISAIPAVVQRLYAREGFSEAYGKVFTAWGLAGLAGPLMAGMLFDATQGYGPSLAIAAALSFVSAGLSVRLPKAS